MSLSVGSPARRVTPARASVSRKALPLSADKLIDTAGVTAPERGVVQLTLTGVLDLESRAALETTLDRWAGELCHLEVRDELVAEPSESDLLSLGESPVIGTVARELVALAAGEPGQRDVASLALRLLYLEHRRRGPGA